ncbi:ferredoxin [Amycolatopsis sp. WGS_07]|uniref:ferredoxin n=1 Tax=Amycolatopsis sp. WGS_07 TaxID=3076764 RepID=UPI003873300B
MAARLSFALTCFALSWGVFVKTGWLRALSGRKATTNSHMVLATLALAFGGIHATAFLFLANAPFSLVRLIVPFAAGGTLRHALGIIGLELMLAIAVSVSVRRFLSLRRWLWLHRLAYTALVLIAVHSVFGAVVNGHLVVLAIGAVALLLPTAVVAVLRFIPARWLGSRAEGDPPPWSGLAVSVDSRRCHQYGVCQREAAAVFQITTGASCGTPCTRNRCTTRRCGRRPAAVRCRRSRWRRGDDGGTDRGGRCRGRRAAGGGTLA